MSIELPPPIDDIDYEALLADARARIRVHNPDWTSYNDSDPGMTLLQLFAFMADSIVYRANLIPERNRRAFLRLLGVDSRGPVPAHGLVTFDGTRGPITTHLVPDGAKVAAGNVSFHTTHAIDVLPLSLVACAKLPSATQLDEETRAAYLAMYEDLDPSAEEISFYDTHRLRLPAGATNSQPIHITETLDGCLWVALMAPGPKHVEAARDLIGGKTLSLGIVPGITDASRTLPPASVQRSVAGPRLTVSTPIPVNPGNALTASYRSLDIVEHGDVLTAPGVIDVRLPSGDELTAWTELDAIEDGYGDFPPVLEPGERDRLVTWLRLRRASGTTTGEPGTSLGASFSWVGVNATGVVQLEHTTEERLPPGTGESDQVAHLGHRSVVSDTVKITVDGAEWARVDDLRTAPPEVRVGAAPGPRDIQRGASPDVFTCGSDGTVRFGDGMRGARPPNGARIRASYASSVGGAGVLPADAIGTVFGLPPGLQVTNPIPTWGGQDAETMEEAESRMSEAVHHRDRLVTAGDFREITWRAPGVDLARVEVLPLFHPLLPEVESPGVVTVMVVPRFDPAQPDAPRPDRMFLDAVCSHLDERRLVTTELHVLGPKYVDVAVSVGFDPAPGRDVPDVRERIATTVRSLLAPIDLFPGDDFEGWPLARTVDPLEVLTVVARVDGVARVNGVRLHNRGGEPLTEPLPLAGLELPRLVGLSIQPGDPPPTGPIGRGDGGDVTDGPSRRLLAVPAIPEEC